MMRCEENRLLLEEYADGELASPAARTVSTHLAACEECTAALEWLSRERELYSWYEDEIWHAGDVEISPSFWAGVSERVAEDRAAHRAWPLVREWLRTPAYSKPAFAVAALLLVVMAFGWALFIAPHRARPGVEVVTQKNRTDAVPAGVPTQGSEVADTGQAHEAAAQNADAHQGARAELRRPAPAASASPHAPLPSAAAGTRAARMRNRAAPLFPGGRVGLRADELQPAGFDEVASSSDLEVNEGHDSETARHFSQAQILLRSFRHANPSSLAGLAYEKQLSRRLFQRNVLLRLGAASRGDLPVEKALSNIEPVLLDISHLSAQPSPEELQPIRNRIQRGELLAALQLYQSRPWQR